MSKKDSRLVYSDELGGRVPQPGDEDHRPEGDGVVRVRRETKGRKGKTVTTVSGVQADAAELKKLAKALKKKCGTGGAIKDWVIEIQGDHRETVVAELERRGFTVKLAGG